MENHSEWSEATVRWSDHASACTLHSSTLENQREATHGGTVGCGTSFQGHGSLCTCLVSLSISCMQTWMKISRAIRPKQEERERNSEMFPWVDESWLRKNWACHNLRCHKALCEFPVSWNSHFSCCAKTYDGWSCQSAAAHASLLTPTIDHRAKANLEWWLARWKRRLGEWTITVQRYAYGSAISSYNVYRQVGVRIS